MISKLGFGEVARETIRDWIDGEKAKLGNSAKSSDLKSYSIWNFPKHAVTCKSVFGPRFWPDPRRTRAGDNATSYYTIQSGIDSNYKTSSGLLLGPALELLLHIASQAADGIRAALPAVLHLLDDLAQLLLDLLLLLR